MSIQYLAPKPLLLVMVIMFTITACSSTQPTKTLVLDYSDFGPQVIAYDLIGYEWYQWQSEGGPDPQREYDVKVVVFRNITLEKVKEMYPVIEGKQDYRYVDYNVALDFLKKYEGDPDLDHLRKTKSKIIEKLGN